MPQLNTPQGNIYFEQHGSRAAPPVLLIHGIGCQLIHWPESLVSGLVENGLRVITFDNRDVGLSFQVDSAPPDIMSLVAAQTDPSAVTPAYSLSDMAQDVVYLLNHVGQSGAHVVGASMGGMIAQRLAIHHPARVFSLTCLMSTTSNPELQPPSEEAVGALASGFLTTDRESTIEATIATGKILGGATYDSREFGIARFAELAYDRAYRPEGSLRQFAAILTDGSRKELLSSVSVPTLAIHGKVDALLRPDGSWDIVDAVRQGELLEIENLGHDLSEPVLPEIVNAIVAHIKKARNSLR